MDANNEMNYFEHFADNCKAGFKLLLLSFFHFLHGIVRNEKTSHKYWGVGGNDGERENNIV